MQTKEEVMEYVFSIEFGGMLRSELECLYDLAEGRSCIEIGSLVGKSTCAVAPLAEKIFCLDCWSFDNSYDLLENAVSKDHYSSLHRFIEEKYGKPMYDVFLDNTKKYEAKIVPIKGDSKVVHKYLNDDSFDLVLIDGDHSYEGTITDFRNFLPKLKIGGLMCFHDYGNKEWVGVVKAVHEALDGGLVKLLFQEGTMVVCEKVKR